MSGTVDHPRVVLAADHRARGIVTIERYADYIGALERALPHCDGILASTQPMRDLRASGAVTAAHSTYLSVNRTGLAGSVFELDDRLVATPEAAAAAGHTGVKLMVRIDRSDARTADQLALLGTVLERCRDLGLGALVEPLSWKDGAVDRTPDAVVLAAVVAHDLGAPVLKVPVPAVAPAERAEAMARVVGSVGVPVLVLGGPRTAGREEMLEEIRDAMDGGASGVAIGRAVYQDPDPAAAAAAVAAVVSSALAARA